MEGQFESITKLQFLINFCAMQFIDSSFLTVAHNSWNPWNVFFWFDSCRWFDKDKLQWFPYFLSIKIQLCAKIWQFWAGHKLLGPPWANTWGPTQRTPRIRCCAELGAFIGQNCQGLGLTEVGFTDVMTWHDGWTHGGEGLVGICTEWLQWLFLVPILLMEEIPNNHLGIKPCK